MNSLNKNSHTKIFKNTIIKKKRFKIAPASNMSACLHAVWELAKLLQQTQDSLANPAEFMR